MRLPSVGAIPLCYTFLSLAGCGDFPEQPNFHDPFRPDGCERGIRSDAGCPDARELPASVATVVVLPDTQYYASYYTSFFSAQTRWILEQSVRRNIRAVFHVGDIVDTPFAPNEWSVAQKALQLLDGFVPYVLAPGNHDQGADRVGRMNEYFPRASMPWLTGTMEEGQVENSYALLDIGPQKWVALALEFGPREKVIAWADSILKANAHLPAMLVTHAYLYYDGTRYDWAAKQTAQNYNPHWYGYTPAEGTNDGEEMWQKLIVSNPNVRLVFSGHSNPTPYALARRTDTRPAGGLPVHQLLQNFQSNVNGGDGFFRLLEFDYDEHVIRVATYSPTRRVFITDEQGQFTLSLD